MLSKMGMNVPGGMGGGAKVNFGAMQSQLNRNMKQAQMRERLLKKVQEKQQATATSASASLPVNGKTTAIFQSGEKPAKTPRAPAPAASAPCVSAASAPCVSAAPAPNVASAASTQGPSNSQGNVKQKSD
jgi:hypothetical protein